MKQYNALSQMVNERGTCVGASEMFVCRVYESTGRKVKLKTDQCRTALHGCKNQLLFGQLLNYRNKSLVFDCFKGVNRDYLANKY